MVPTNGTANRGHLSNRKITSKEVQTQFQVTNDVQDDFQIDSVTFNHVTDYE